jgi:hypothetical protein
VYTVKKVIVFPVPSRDVTNQTLPGREFLNYSRRGRVWFVTSPRLGTGKTIAIFYSVSSPVAVVLGGFDPRLADAHQVGRIVAAAAAARPRGRQG